MSDEIGARSIPDFCAAHGISRASFYNHIEDMPRTIRVGARRLVPRRPPPRRRSGRAGGAARAAVDDPGGAVGGGGGGAGGGYLSLSQA